MKNTPQVDGNLFSMFAGEEKREKKKREEREKKKNDKIAPKPKCKEEASSKCVRRSQLL